MDRSHSIQRPCDPCFNTPMDAVLISCRFLLVTVRALLDGVRVRDNVYLLRPAFGSRHMAGRLARGLAFVEAYLRRVLLIMALELEPTLVDVRGPMKRPHGRKGKGISAPHFCIFPKEEPPSEVLLYALEQRKDIHARNGPPPPVAMGRLYQRLDQLCAIVADPLVRAKRLAFYLARNREGRIFAPDPMVRPPGYWSSEAKASFYSLAFDIENRSRTRPPPLPPPRRCWPSITCFV
jgi:hypothetical protein